MTFLWMACVYVCLCLYLCVSVCMDLGGEETSRCFKIQMRGGELPLQHHVHWAANPP